MPLYAYDAVSFTSSAKAIPIRIVRSGTRDRSDRAVEEWRHRSHRGLCGARRALHGGRFLEPLRNVPALRSNPMEPFL